MTPTGRRPSGPPIQNIPVRTEEGQKIREAIIDAMERKMTIERNEQNLVQRTALDTTGVRPWVWGTLVGNSHPVEVVSYPIPAEGKEELDIDATVMIRMIPGDPSSVVEAWLRGIACFDPIDHEWHQRPKRWYGPHEFVFDD